MGEECKGFSILGALRRCLLAAALLLGLRLCAELQRAGPQPPALSSPPGQAPRPPGSHLQPAPGQRRGASRRQVTYVRSGRRAPARGGRSGTPEPGCCAVRGRPRREGPRWQIDLQPWAGPARSLDEEASRFLRYISTIQVVFQAQVGLETKSCQLPLLKDLAIRVWEVSQFLLIDA